jgi:hypothetical protein
MTKPQSQKSTGSSGPRLPDFSALAAAVSTPSTSASAPNFDAIAKVVGNESSEEANEEKEVEAEAGDNAEATEAAAEAPIQINTGAKPAVKAAPAAPATPVIQVAPVVKPAAQPASVKAPVAKPVVAKAAPVAVVPAKPAASKPVASKLDSKKPSLDFLAQASVPEEPAASPFEITTTKPEVPAVKANAAPVKPLVEKTTPEKAAEKPAAEKPLKRASSAAASLPGFAEFAAIAGSVSETAPSVDISSEPSKESSATPQSPLPSNLELAGKAVAGQVAAAATISAAPKPTAEATPKKRGTANTSAKHPLTYVVDVTAGLLFATAGYQLYQAFTTGALAAGIPSAIGTIATGVGLIALSQAIRLLLRIANSLNA